MDTHRGRIQVQGKDMQEDESRAWSQGSARLASDAHKDLADLEDSISTAQRDLRRRAFCKARRFVTNASDKGGVAAPVTQSFSDPRLDRTARVDIEVNRGTAFV